MPRHPHYFTPAELAELARVSPDTILRWGTNGTNGCPKPLRLSPKKILFHRAESLRWLGLTDTAEREELCHAS